MPPKPETFSALSHSAERGESLGGLGAQALLERSRQILPPETQGAANATALVRRQCVIPHVMEQEDAASLLGSEPVRHPLLARGGALQIKPLRIGDARQAWE